MLPRRQRLGRRLAERVSRSRVFARGTYTALRVIREPSITASRAAIVVPKRVLRFAAERNRLKRRLAELLAPRLSFLPPGAYLITVTTAPKTNAFGALRKDLELLFRPARS